MNKVFYNKIGDKMLKEFIMQKLPTKFCHASTIVKLKQGGYMCCWFGGSHEGNADVAIYGSRRLNNIWSEPVKLANGAEANWNPVLFYREDGTLQLFYKQGQKIAEWKTYVLLSYDDGLTWSEPKEIVAGDTSGGRGPVRNKPLRLACGRVLAGGSTEHGIWQAFADLSDDDCKSWHKSGPITIANLSYKEGEKTATSDITVSEQSFFGRGVIQPTLWQDAQGMLHMLLRSSEGWVYRSDSHDNGETWSKAYPLSLPNNNSGLDLVMAPFDGELYLLCNPVAANWGLRSPMSLFKSTDNGCSWQKLYDLATEKNEFSYPAIIAEGNGLTLTFTWKRENIVFFHIDMAELTAGNMQQVPYQIPYIF